MMSLNHPMMVRRYKDLIHNGAMGTYAERVALEVASYATLSKEVSDLDATLKDGTAKFQELIAWVAAWD